MHLLSLRARHVEIDALPKRAITGCFRIEHVRSFLKANQEFSLGIMGTRIYKYSFTGHRVAEMDAKELEPYLALVGSMCKALMERQDEELRKLIKEGIVEVLCSV